MYKIQLLDGPLEEQVKLVPVISSYWFFYRYQAGLPKTEENTLWIYYYCVAKDKHALSEEELLQGKRNRRGHGREEIQAGYKYCEKPGERPRSNTYVDVFVRWFQQTYPLRDWREDCRA